LRLSAFFWNILFETCSHSTALSVRLLLSLHLFKAGAASSLYLTYKPPQAAARKRYLHATLGM
jgi:hypothetical protein